VPRVKIVKSVFKPHPDGLASAGPRAGCYIAIQSRTRLPPILEVLNLTKTFGTVTAVQDLSFSVQPGDIYGFLGQNGAGKSTTMRMMLGLVRPDKGTIQINGEPFGAGHQRMLRRIGAIIERPDMYGYMSGWDNLRIFGRLSGLTTDKAKLNALLELVSLKGREHDKVKAYSQGMKQRLGIAIALVHDPDILMLDEPTNGLDPQGIAAMRELIIHLSRDRGKTVIISSHLLHEVEQMANRMLIIHEGCKMVEGDVKELLSPEDTLMEVLLEPDERIALMARSHERWRAYLREADAARLLFRMNPDHAPDLLRWLVSENAAVRSMSSRHSLEAYFLSLTHDRDHAAAFAH
jgi:ABC-2 type transport system ATP-binding protein